MFSAGSAIDNNCPSCGVGPGEIHRASCTYGQSTLAYSPPAPISVGLVIPIPPEVEPYRDDIRRFVHAMIYKLKVHHRKGRWEEKTMAEYLPLLDGERDELVEAVKGGNLLEILTEAADCANMALIIASIATERGK
jgi:NTP pyrophosphatase (non-canonical NTP hydrolase)